MDAIPKVPCLPLRALSQGLLFKYLDSLPSLVGYMLLKGRILTDLSPSMVPRVQQA